MKHKWIFGILVGMLLILAGCGLETSMPSQAMPPTPTSEPKVSPTQEPSPTQQSSQTEAIPYLRVRDDASIEITYDGPLPEVSILPEGSLSLDGLDEYMRWLASKTGVVPRDPVRIQLRRGGGTITISTSPCTGDGCHVIYLDVDEVIEGDTFNYSVLQRYIGTEICQYWTTATQPMEYIQQEEYCNGLGLVQLAKSKERNTCEVYQQDIKEITIWLGNTQITTEYYNCSFYDSVPQLNIWLLVSPEK